LRAVLKEIIVTIEANRLHLVLHWQGGDHTRLEVSKNRSGQNRWNTDVERVVAVCDAKGPVLPCLQCWPPDRLRPCV
jgi:hypothetical protein